jgi:hypothetical protein
MLVGQIPSGQCILELVAPDSPESPLAKMVAEDGERAMPMVAIEVQDLAAEIARYRAAGIEVPEPQPGIIPNSVRTSIPADRGFGLSIQLLAYEG